MATYDFDVDFSGFAKIPKIYNEARSERLLSDLGKGLASGSLDYKQAAGLAAEANRPDLTLSLLKIGQDQADQEDFARTAKLIIPGYGGSQTPQPAASPMPAAPQPSPRPSGGPIAGPGTLPPQVNPDGTVAPARATVQPSARVWGDNEPGAPYDTAPPTPAARIAQGFPGGSTAAFAPTPVPVSREAPAAPQPQAVAQAPIARPATPVTNPATDKLDQIILLMSHKGIKPGQMEGFKLLAQKEIANSTIPDDVKKAYAYRVERLARGESDMSMFEIEKSLKRAGVQDAGETEEQKELGKGAAKRANDMIAAGVSAPKRLANINRIDALLANLAQGKVQPTLMNIAAWAKSFGLPDGTAESLGLNPKAVGDAQALQALSNKSVVDMIGQGGFPANNFSDADRKFLVTTVHALGNDPRGNKIISEVGKRIAHLDIEQIKQWQQFRRDPQNKGKGFADFEVQWASKLADADVFGDLRKEAESIVGAPKSAGGAGLQLKPGGRYNWDPQRGLSVGQ